MNAQKNLIEPFLSGLPDSQRTEVRNMRMMILKALPKGYREVLDGNTISYEIPLESFSDTYNGKPLMYLAISVNSSTISLHMMNLYWDKELRDSLLQAFREAERKPDMGKACLRFTSTDQIPLKTISDMIENTPPSDLIESYQRTMGNR